MLRYTILVLSAVMAITAAASAQITVTIGGGQNSHYHNNPHQRPVYYPPQGQGYYVNHNGHQTGQGYCNSHAAYCNHQRPVVYGHKNNGKHRGKHKNRGRWVQQGHCPPNRF